MGPYGGSPGRGRHFVTFGAPPAIKARVHRPRESNVSERAGATRGWPCARSRLVIDDAALKPSLCQLVSRKRRLTLEDVEAHASARGRQETLREVFGFKAVVDPSRCERSFGA